MDKIFQSTKITTGKVRVIIADDHPIVLYGMKKVLEATPNIEVVAAISSIPELELVMQSSSCDVLICDYSFEDDNHADGLQLTARLVRKFPETKIIIFTAHDDVYIARRVLQLGAAGFVSKGSYELANFPAVIQDVATGKHYVDPRTSLNLIEQTLRSDQNTLETKLTPREAEIVRMFTNGMTVTDISIKTNRSLKTISTQKKNAMKKLGAKNDIELLVMMGKLKE
ncbi:response regulator transcription factor [Serratia quinivorans]|uniref:response regulator transcription factor n=1 Tax=Serratia quinivorans TaxID=137545 RepID=UPI00217B37B1|nr:response regulator transcription factor [Serratia quinivorans]CAI1074428.1 Capsular synthesis regulator component B [Serratia quinivorans]